MPFRVIPPNDGVINLESVPAFKKEIKHGKEPAASVKFVNRLRIASS